jgi:hypothetical protein
MKNTLRTDITLNFLEEFIVEFSSKMGEIYFLTAGNKSAPSFFSLCINGSK